VSSSKTSRTPLNACVALRLPRPTSAHRRFQPRRHSRACQHQRCHDLPASSTSRMVGWRRTISSRSLSLRAPRTALISSVDAGSVTEVAESLDIGRPHVPIAGSVANQGPRRPPGETEASLGMSRSGRSRIRPLALHRRKGSSPRQTHASRRFSALLRQSCLCTSAKSLTRGNSPRVLI
jgi:hypothetical protein